MNLRRTPYQTKQFFESVQTDLLPLCIHKVHLPSLFCVTPSHARSHIFIHEHVSTLDLTHACSGTHPTRPSIHGTAYIQQNTLMNAPIENLLTLLVCFCLTQTICMVRDAAPHKHPVLLPDCAPQNDNNDE